jgi:prophage regulatory protein
VRFIKIGEVKEITGLSRTAIYDSIAKGRFPKQLKISERSVVWDEAEIHQWMEGCLQSRN